jgi:hypothetical protein
MSAAGPNTKCRDVRVPVRCLVLRGHCPSRSSVAREPTHQARQFVKFRLFPRRRHEPLPEASKRLPTHSLWLLGNVGWVIPDPLEVRPAGQHLDHFMASVGPPSSRARKICGGNLNLSLMSGSLLMLLVDC